MLKLTKIYWALILFLCLCAVIDNLLISDTENTLEISSKTEVKSIKINPQFKKYAHSISVKVISKGKDSGSGVVVGKQGNKYLVLTNDSVVRNHDNIVVKTADGINHQAAIMGVDSFFGSADDTALLSFSSGKNYQPVQLNSVDTGVEKKRIYAVGYSADMDKFIVEPGTIERIPIQPFKKGYQIGYTSNIIPGMSGGAILDELGDLVGINGNGASDLSYTDFRYEEDRTKPTLKEIKQFKSLNWGLSTHRLLTKLNSETLTDLKIIKAYGLPIPETVDDIASTQLTGWLADLETEAKQITVRIDSSSGANGSGVIIAQEGNTYTVLTADHVLCEKDDNNKCIDYSYEIVTPDGNKHTLDASTVKAEAGVDLATFKFTSNQSYQIAQLADYPIQNNNAVFVAGYPKLGKNTPPQWQFSLGYGLDKEQGLLEVNISNNSSNSESAATSSQSSLAGGYEMVYTSPTYGGMSGGAVLDRDGRVIGIHGQAEGETIIDSQGGASNKIQLGSSLGIPISTFVGLKARLGVEEISPVAENAPAELNSREQEAFETAILGTRIENNNATAKRWLERGNQLWRLARYKEAVAAFDKAIELNKAEFNYLAHYGKGLALLYQGKSELALASLERATTSNPKFAPAFNKKSAILEILNRFDEALVAIETAIAIEPKNANYHFVKAFIFEELKLLDKAITAYDKAIKISPRATFYGRRGMIYDQQKEAELALADFDRAVQLNPNHAYAHNNRGHFYQKQGKVESALADFNRAIQLNSKFTQAYLNRGVLYDRQRRLELALSDYDKAIDINANYAEAYNSRGTLYYEKGEIDLALADFNQALRLNPNLAGVYNNRGNFYKDRGEVELALSDYNKALQLNPNYANYYYNRGIFFADRGKIELALADFNQALQINPDYAEAYYNRGTLYYNRGEAELALSDYNQALKLNPKSALAYVSRGNVHRGRRETKLALADYNQALAIDPNSAYAYNHRGILYYNQGKAELALADYIQAIQLNPNVTDAYINRGTLYYEKGEIDLALSDYNQALKLNPKSAKAYYNRGALYQEQGELELALSDYNHALEFNPKSAKAYYNRSVLYQQMGNKSAAISNLRQAQQLFIAQKNMTGAEQAASLLKTLEQTQTQTAFNNSQNESIDRKDAQAYYDRAFEYHQQQEYDLALADYSQVIELDPDLEKAYVNRGLIYQTQGKDEEAISDYNKAIEINPNNPNSYQNRGVVYFEREEYQLAEADWSKVIELNPEDGLAYYNRGFLYLELGDKSLAKADLETARRLSTSQNNTELAKKTANALQQLP